MLIGGRTVDSWYGGLVQAEIHSELSAVVCHVAKERFVQGHVSRCVEQNPASHNEAPRPLEALVGCSLKGLRDLMSPASSVFSSPILFSRTLALNGSAEG